MSWAACSVCRKEFSSDRSFDRHRVAADRRGNRRCLTAREMRSLKWHKDRFGRWVDIPMVPRQASLPVSRPNTEPRRVLVGIKGGARKLRRSDFSREHESAQQQQAML